LRPTNAITAVGFLAILSVPRGGASTAAVVGTPAGGEGLTVEWIKVPAPGGTEMLAAVARPKSAGPFPAVIILHGTHGFAREYVQLAQAFAGGGVLAIAPCWFAAGGGPGSRFVTPIGCPHPPPMPSASSPEALGIVETLVQTARALPEVRPNAVALFGHSRGAGAALHYVLSRGDVCAAVLDSAGYPAELDARAAGVKAPILLLHGTDDSPADGGSAMTNVKMARDFEAALRRAGKTVESRYYPGAGHNGIFTDPAQRADAVQRIVAFVRRDR